MLNVMTPQRLLNQAVNIEMKSNVKLISIPGILFTPTFNNYN